MTATRAGSPLGSPFRAKFARVTDPGLMSSGERKTIDYLVSVASRDLRARLRMDANAKCAEEWQKRGGLDGTLVCSLCDITPVTYRAERYPRHQDCEVRDGCSACDLDFYSSAVSKRTGRTLTLCEFCYEGEWTRFGRRVFEVVKVSHLFLVGCAESLIWAYEGYGGRVLSNALGRGVEMIRRSVYWASSSDEASVSLESVLRVRILEDAFAPTEFTRACRHRLREEEGLVVGRKGPGEPDLV